MELFLPLPVIESKNVFNKSIPIWSNDSNMVFRNRKRNYLNRKWNYFFPFQLSDQKTSFKKVSPFGPTIQKWYSEKGNGIILTGNGIISPLFSHQIKKLFYTSIPIWSNDSKMVFRNRKWNYLNRKWNYFSPFQS